MATSVQPKRILLAPLDWGLGHATRCIPVIKILQQQGCEVWIATSGIQEVLLRQECPNAHFLHLPGYGVRYGQREVLFRLILQLPKILFSMVKEHWWLKRIAKKHQIDAVISDNRYGLYHPKLPSILITHQLDFRLPTWLRPFYFLVHWSLHKLISRFKQCWVPDLELFERSLAGTLSHPERPLKFQTKYIGGLSRFPVMTQPGSRTKAILISISGPEPQRTSFEMKVIAQLPQIDHAVTLVRGLPGNAVLPEVPRHVEVFNHLPAKLMEQKMMDCGLLISRSGYSTLMDVQVTGIPFACVPTPGQTEQEYLAKRLDENGWAWVQSQADFNLKALVLASSTQPKTIPTAANQQLLADTLTVWLAEELG